MKEITKGKGKGQWWGIRLTKKRTAYMRCPDCNFFISLIDNIIEDDGTIKDLLVCMGGGCKFRDHVKLIGW